MSDIRGRTVVVVSVSSGRGENSSQELANTGHLGDACTRDLAAHGANVVAVDSDAEVLRSLTDSIAESGATASTVVADLLDAAALDWAAEQCRELHGGVDALVTCHSDLELASIEHSSVDSWRRVIEFNLLGPVLAARAFLPLLKLARAPSIVHCGSIDGTLGNPQVPSYSAAKGGLVPLTHVMAEEFGAYGIRVNLVARAMTVQPGEVPHPMFAPLIEQTPLGRPASPVEVASVIRFFISDDASYLSGRLVLPVDGGRSGITPGTRPVR